jgi:hypothetical protein
MALRVARDLIYDEIFPEKHFTVNFFHPLKIKESKQILGGP